MTHRRAFDPQEYELGAQDRQDGESAAKELRVSFAKKCRPQITKAKGLDSHLILWLFYGRGERIRTSDSCVPNAVLYQAELHPDFRLSRQ